ncbi:hypothetical protein E2C01_074616 [Portunus trituberculatus]|uniref:Transmembrane protein n=1 Tax=Portunus trituberculatus TaxID=210409 RepID=A0A5B7I8G7_PORTR|nr:hypothetical protein [Portunus trituberculatus]
MTHQRTRILRHFAASPLKEISSKILKTVSPIHNVQIMRGVEVHQNMDREVMLVVVVVVVVVVAVGMMVVILKPLHFSG